MIDDLIVATNVENDDLNKIYTLNKDGFALILPSYLELNQKESKVEGVGKGRIVFKSSKKDNLKFHYLKISEKLYLERMITFSNGRQQEEFTDFNNIEVNEFIEKNGNIIVSLYLSGYMFIFEKECKKYSQEYYELYASVLSLRQVETKSHEDLDKTLLEQYTCITKNGAYIYSEYKLDIVHYNPLNLSLRIKNEQILDYLETEVLPKFKIYVPSQFISKDNKSIKVTDLAKEELISKVKDRISELSV